MDDGGDDAGEAASATQYKSISKMVVGDADAASDLGWIIRRIAGKSH